LNDEITTEIGNQTENEEGDREEVFSHSIYRQSYLVLRPSECATMGLTSQENGEFSLLGLAVSSFPSYPRTLTPH
jgi:hypothetical protein